MMIWDSVDEWETLEVREESEAGGRCSKALDGKGERNGTEVSISWASSGWLDVSLSLMI